MIFNPLIWTFFLAQLNNYKSRLAASFVILIIINLKATRDMKPAIAH